MSLHDELLCQQLETINSFIRSLEEISQNSQQAQRLMVQQGSSNLPKSILGQVEALIEKEQQNASNLQILEKIEATEMVKEQQHRLEEVRMNLTTPLTSEVEAYEPENYGGARPTITSRAKLASTAPSVMPQEAVAQAYSSHFKSRQEQQLEDCAALLRDEIFCVVLGTVNKQHGSASKIRKNKSGSDYSDDEVFHLPQVPDMPIAGSGHWHKVTFRSPVVISSMPHLVPQPVSFNVSRIPDIEKGEEQLKMLPLHCKVFSLQLRNSERSTNQKYKKLRVDTQPKPC